MELFLIKDFGHLQIYQCSPYICIDILYIYTYIYKTDMKITSINRDTGRIYLYSHIYILYIDSHYFF